MTADFITEPPIDVHDAGLLASIGDEWDRACRYVLRARATDDTRPILTYVGLDVDGGLVAVDGHRLHMVKRVAEVDRTGWPEGRAIIPIPAPLVKPGVQINLTSERALYSADHPRYSRVWWRVPIISYPEFHTLLSHPVTSRAEIVDPRQLAAAVRYPQGIPLPPKGEVPPSPWLANGKRKLTRDEAGMIRLDIAGNVVSVQHIYRWPYTVSCVGRLVEGAPIERFVRPGYLFDALAGLRGPVTLDVAPLPTPMLLRSGATVAAIMPMTMAARPTSDRWPGRPAPSFVDSLRTASGDDR